MVKKKDVEQDKSIKDLKKKVKELTKKYLKERKKKVKDPKKFKKISDNIKRRTGLAQTPTELQKLLNLLKGGGGGAIAPPPTSTTGIGRGAIQPVIQTTPATVGTISERITPKPKKSSTKDPLGAWADMSKSWNDLKDKYNDDTLTAKDLSDLYKKTKAFATSIDQNLPSAENVFSAYGVGRGMYNYLKRFMNDNRPQGEVPLVIRRDPAQPAIEGTEEQLALPPPTTFPTQPPTTPPTTPPTEPPTPPPPTPPPTPPEPPPQSWADYISENAPTSLTAPALGIGALGIGAMGMIGYRNRMQNRDRRIDRDLEVRGFNNIRQAQAMRIVADATRNALENAPRQAPRERDVRRGLDSSQDVAESVNQLDVEIQQNPETGDFTDTLSNLRARQRRDYMAKGRAGGSGFRQRDATQSVRLQAGQGIEGARFRTREARTVQEGEQFIEGVAPPTERALRSQQRGSLEMARQESLTTLAPTEEIPEAEFRARMSVLEEPEVEMGEPEVEME